MDAVALGTGTKCETTVDEVKQLLRTCQIVLRDDTAHVTLWRVCYNQYGEAIFVLQCSEILNQFGSVFTFLHLHAQDGNVVDNDDVGLTSNGCLFNISDHSILKGYIEISEIVRLQRHSIQRWREMV